MAGKEKTSKCVKRSQRNAKKHGKGNHIPKAGPKKTGHKHKVVRNEPMARYDYTSSNRWMDMVSARIDQADLGLVVGSPAHVVALEILSLVTDPNFHKKSGSSRFGSAARNVRSESKASYKAFGVGQQAAYKAYDNARKAVEQELAAEAAEHRGHNVVYSV